MLFAIRILDSAVLALGIPRRLAIRVNRLCYSIVVIGIFKPPRPCVPADEAEEFSHTTSYAGVRAFVKQNYFLNSNRGLRSILLDDLVKLSESSQIL